jgi:RNA polymerase sigma factor (sigma-70 family)
MSDLPRTDGELLKQAADGAQDAWDELINRYVALLWSIGRAYRLDTPDAADAVQTTWLRLLEHLDRIEEPERLVSWLATTMRRECLRILRHTGRECPHPPDVALFNTVDPSEPADAAMIRADRDAQLWKAFDQMPDRCRRLLRVLMTSPPPPYEAVAAMLEVPVGSIGPTRQRCLQRLRKLLEQPSHSETFSC